MTVLPSSAASRWLLAIAAVLLTLRACEAEVVMVYSIQRHGARNALAKTLLLQVSLRPPGHIGSFRSGRSFAVMQLIPDGP